MEMHERIRPTSARLTGGRRRPHLATLPGSTGGPQRPHPVNFGRPRPSTARRSSLLRLPGASISVVSARHERNTLLALPTGHHSINPWNSLSIASNLASNTGQNFRNHSGQSFRNPQQVHIIPAQREHLSAPQPGGHGQQNKWMEPSPAGNISYQADEPHRCRCGYRSGQSICVR